MKKKLILLDWDGTIADSMELCVAGVADALREIGYPVPARAVLEKCNGPTYDEAAVLMGVNETDREAFLSHRRAADMRALPLKQRLYPGMRELLESLAAQADLAIVSNGLENYILTSMRLTGLRPELFVRISAFQPGRNKTEAVAALLRELAPEDAVMVGDTAGDIRAGHDNGIRTIAAGYGYGGMQACELADCTAEDPEELRKLLVGWLTKPQNNER